MDAALAEKINRDASALMKQGIALLDERRPGAAAEALEFFNRALQLRSDLPLDADPFNAYLLAACWLNRGDSLMQLGQADKIPVAINSYDEGIAVMRRVSLDEDPRYPRRLAMGLQNRGLAQLAQAEAPAGLDAALDSFEQALDVLEGDAASPLADRDYLLAGVWANIAIARATAKTAEADVLSRAAALRAIGLAGTFEADDIPSAEVGLKARYVLCQVIAGDLPPAVKGAKMPESVHEATDHAEAGLALAKRWEARGELRFWPLAHDLYRFAEAVYERYQPQFLEEFRTENAAFCYSSDQRRIRL